MVEPEAREFTSNGRTLLYRLLAPAVTEPGQKCPLVILLHGSGERGADNRLPLEWFWSTRLPSPMTRPEVAAATAYLVVPQCPAGEGWVDVPWEEGSYASPPISGALKRVLALVDRLLEDLPIDPDRVSIVGMSMGGYGAFDAVQRRPELFAACVPICGAGDPSKAREIAHVPVWAFHGAADPVVPVSGSRDMIAALKAAGARPKYTEYPTARHNSWSPAFAEEDFWNWIFAQKRRSKGSGGERVSPG